MFSLKDYPTNFPQYLVSHLKHQSFYIGHLLQYHDLLHLPFHYHLICFQSFEVQQFLLLFHMPLTGRYHSLFYDLNYRLFIMTYI